ncbi:hypothetical protein I4U23_024597 [Adineta vaga]|nr:hypothetical protein I4U23_024597 [Adineta vaga]
MYILDLCQSNNNPPVIIEQPQDITAELDKPMAIHCRAESSTLDDLQIDWYKDGRLVTIDPNARIITEFMALHVINTMPQDAGIYYCIAKNSHGQTESRKARIQFLKLEKEFIISPLSTSVSIGEQVRLSCQPPYGSPSPKVYWSKDNKNLSIPLDRYDLVLSSVQRSDFGSYRCIASNGLIRQSSPAYLTEFHRPKLTIQPSSSRVDLRARQSIHLQCQTDNDQYELEWHFRTTIIRNSTLDLSSIEFNRSGIYICMARLQQHVFTKQIFLAVYEKDTLNNQEIFYSQTNLTLYAGRSAVIECPLPFNSEKKISWIINNQTELNNFTFDFIDQTQYSFRIDSIREFYHHMLFRCSYQNNDHQSQGLVELNVEKIKPPPIVFYVPNNQTVPLGTQVIFSCQSNDENTVQWWFTSSYRPHKTIRIEENRKYRIEINYDLIIRHSEKNDAGVYKCISTNTNHEETVWTATLTVEVTRSDTKLDRIERKHLPSAPSQPLPMTINSNSIELSWNIRSTDILDYLIEYFDLNPMNKNLQWERYITKTSNTQQMINNLKSNTTYQFLIRARNSFGYGPPSILSELIETRTNQSSNDDLIYLYDPITIQETSMTIKWNILQKNHLIKRISIYIINDKEANERIETITNSVTSYTINNLRPNRDYSIYVVPMMDLPGRSSNTITTRTLESTPLTAPTNIHVQLLSITSLSVRWNPPLENETNGDIIAYKIHCLTTNETNSIRLTNISSDVKGLFIKSLIENAEYCISIAARTRIGYGRYSQPICVTMNTKFLHINQSRFRHRLRQFISEPWFLPVIILSSICFTCAFSYGIWLCFHYLTQQHRHPMKFNNSPSSSNQSVELPIHKTLSNGNRYDLIKDTPLPPPPVPALWLDSIPNSIRLQCCSTTAASASSNSEHYSMSIHKNPINALLHESRQQQLNPYATTGIFQQTTPIYSETIHTPISSPHQLFDSQQQRTVSSTSVQYQPPWLDHHSSSTLQYRSQSRTSYGQYRHHCLHCTSQSHPHTPSSTHRIIPTSLMHHDNNNSTNTFPMTNTNEMIKMNTENNQLLTNSPVTIEHQSSDLSMMKAVGEEAIITSWAGSINGNHLESISSTSTDKHNHSIKSTQEQNHMSSEGSIFSDTDIQQHDDSNPSSLVNFERGPSFLSPNV